MTTDDPDENPTQFGMDDTVPGGMDRTVPAQPANDPADRTLPSQPLEEDRTVPSQPKSAQSKPTPAKPSPAKPTPAKPAAGGDVDHTEPALQRQGPRDAHSGLIGKTLGGCRIDKLLGKGAMGAVYKAKQLKLDRDVAVKVIRPEMMTDARMLKRFEVEARTVGRFNSANVVMVHDVGFEQGVHFLVMEFVQGKNLREHVKLLAGGRLPAGEALPLIRQACAGLNESRRLGVVHRDIKPDNLMLTDQGVLKIADFGIAKPVEQDFNMTMTSELIGTPLYMSPEQCQGGANIDFRSDMYSLGATFFYLLTGEPPIRASSVYELIQTKTKLENLCLWKSLPELDENNPLSRVIERMTANDREHRYESYEELINDLVLVSEGGTITIPARKPKPVEPARVVPRKSKAGLLAAAVALLVLGGGYWWFSNNAAKPANGGQGSGGQANGGQQNGGQGNGNQGNGGAVVPLVLDATAAQAALTNCRQRLRESGGSDVLRRDLLALALPVGMVDDRERLVADVDAAREIERKLAAMARLRDPKPPFDDLKNYFAAVQAAAALDDTAGSDLRAWQQQRVITARAERELGATARSTLLNTFRTWQRERGNATDPATIGALGTRLDAIQASHTALAVLLPEQRNELQQALPTQELLDARAKLTEKPVGDRDRDVSGALAECQKQFADEGPTEAVLNRTRGLQPTREDQVREHEKLLNAIDDGRKYEALARGKRRPSLPVSPFEDVVVFFREVDSALAKLQQVDGQLPKWAQQLRSELRDEPKMQDAVVESCRTMFDDLRGRAEARAAIAELDRRRADLEAAQAAALQLFPQAAAKLAQAIPPAELESLLAKVRAEREKEVLLAAIEAANGQVDRVRGLAAWLVIAADMDRELARLVEVATRIGDASATRSVQQLELACGRWRAVAQRWNRAGGLLADGNLTSCLDELNGVIGSEGGTELRALIVIAEQCRDAFVELENTLDVAAAQKRLASARKLFSETPDLPRGIDAKLRSWEAGFTALRNRAAGMVAIPAGQTRDPAARVPAFFLASTEVSNDQFSRFVNELRTAAVGDALPDRFAAVEAKLAGTGMTAARLERLFGRTARAGKLPIDRVAWFEAAAYVAWYGLSLPSKAEWALAAFGDDKRYTYPWGQDWSSEPEQVNLNDRPVDVDRGGNSWRLQDGVELHHLAGNAAEWLAAPLDTREAPLAGGCTVDRTPTLRRRAGGEFDEADKEDDRTGHGFRAALRPREFAALQWPR